MLGIGTRDSLILGRTRQSQYPSGCWSTVNEATSDQRFGYEQDRRSAGIASDGLSDSGWIIFVATV